VIIGLLGVIWSYHVSELWSRSMYYTFVGCMCSCEYPCFLTEANR